MTTEEKLHRSRSIGDTPSKAIFTKSIDEPLVVVETKDRVVVDPIWITQIDDIEGPLYRKYIQENPKYAAVYTRKSVAAMLSGAAERLPTQYKLVVRASHRPLAVQKMLLRALIDEYKAQHPSASDAAALKFARTYVSDPAISIPPHCCGAAVDVDVIDTQTGKLVDFGCPVNTDSEISFLHTDLITKEQQTNREMLLRAMLEAGFASNKNEWWHYSYGDQTWAHFYHEPQALYGITEPTL